MTKACHIMVSVKPYMQIQGSDYNNELIDHVADKILQMERNTHDYGFTLPSARF